MKTATKPSKTSTTAKVTVKQKLADKAKAKQSQTEIEKTELDTKNIKNTVKKTVESQREMKYIYPEDVKTQEQRKTFRAKTRIKDSKFITDIKKAKDAGKDTKKLEKQYLAFRKETYLVP